MSWACVISGRHPVGDLAGGQDILLNQQLAHLTGLGARVGARPLYFRSALALAIPSRCRSSIISRSNVATAPIIVNKSLPVAEPVYG